MLAAAVRDQQLERVRRRKHADELRDRAKSAGVLFNRAVTDCVNQKARTVYDNQQLIEKETKALAVKTAKFERVVSSLCVWAGDYSFVSGLFLPFPWGSVVMDYGVSGG
jgi:hypothetical protein